MADAIGIAQGALGAVGDIFGGLLGASGDKQAEKAYKTAAKFAEQNAEVAQRSGEIQGAQARRSVFQTISGQESDIAAAGLTSGGSNQYLRRSSIAQGGMTEALVANQTQLNVQGYKAEAAADTAQAAQAAEQATASAGGGLLGAVGSILSIFG